MRGGRRKTSIEWPAAVDDRLRLLVRLAEETGDLGVTSASELLAALICAQPQDGGNLAETISQYRQAEPETVRPAGPSEASPSPAPRRGRPRHGRAKNSPNAEDPR